MNKKLSCIICILAVVMMTRQIACADSGIALPTSSAEYSNEFAQYALKLASVYTADKTKELLETEGYSVIAQNNYDKASDDPAHTCAYTVGTQDIVYDGATRTLILCTIRGTSAGEWYSNFDFAPSHSADADYAENFLFAASDVFIELSTILDSYDSPLVLVVGHSRGAACANLLGVLLNARYDSNDIYVYTFATPNTVRKAMDGCDNIFNIINPCDLVARMPLSSWGYMRAGHDIVLQNDSQLESEIDDALLKLNELAPDIESYYTVRHSLTDAGESEDGMTVFEVMLMLAKNMAADANNTELQELQTDSIAQDSDFADLMEYLSKLSGQWTDNAVLKQHLPDTYMELLSGNTEG